MNAVGRRDRSALETLDALVREGEYLPLALTFLATQFRMALVAKEANLRGALSCRPFPAHGCTDVVFTRRTGLADRREVLKEQLQRGLKLIFETDRDLRSARPDDRT